ncbi:MAG: L-seryl-tRNA(Sec) selenium transferase [Acidimicrobiales bacterium]|nr:L-seryl-tRNA(Sec) selenium transferase [Acidimicrobiales bacterium]HCK73946.1 L-seryl-tRNA(Sec) selenium transferase [Acidimicrobiaceae bacterium]
MRPPSVDALSKSLSDIDLPAPLLVEAARAAIRKGDPDSARTEAMEIRRSLLGPAINATGVLLHTNLGRAPIEYSQFGRASNLEFNLATGGRGSRNSHAADLISRLTGAESALIVNNCSAAVILVLAALARDRAVTVSRGELVEIGGGFRVPDVMAESGTRLVEVGTTNRTRLADYEAAGRFHDIALSLKVHPSNYKIKGFTEETSVRELSQLGPPVVVDIGSGFVDEACQWLKDGRPVWLRDEPAVKQTLESGASLVTFSCDKLFGGPQAGVIAGQRDLIEQCAAHPLMRAFRPGSLILGALQQVALAYLNRDGDSIPFWRMAQTPISELKRRAEAISAGKTISTMSMTGGGSLPGEEIPSVGIELEGDLSACLRQADIPVIARVREQTTIIDLRTVHPEDDELVANAINSCF